MRSSSESTKRARRRCSCRCRLTLTSRRPPSRRPGSSSPRATAGHCLRRPSGMPTSPTPATGPCISKPHRRTSTGARPSPRRCARGWWTRTRWSCCASPWSAPSRSSPTRRSGCASPPTTPSADYLVAADRLTAADFDDPANEKYMAFRGGCYADYLPGWLDVLGTDHVRESIDFDRLIGEQLTTLHDCATWLGLDAARFPADALSSENRTTGYKNEGFQTARARGQRQARARVAAPPGAQAQPACVLLPTERPSRRRSNPQLGARRAGRTLRGAQRPPRSPARRRRDRTPGWLSPSPPRLRRSG